MGLTTGPFICTIQKRTNTEQNAKESAATYPTLIFQSMDNICKAPMAPTSFCSGIQRSGKQIKSAPSVANVCWDTFTCTLGWPVQGIWPPGSDGTDINAVDLLPKYVVKGNGKRKKKHI